MKYKFTKQKNRYDCGAAVCCMLINYLHNTNLTISELKYDNVIFDAEISFYNIETILFSHGIEFKSFYASFNEFCNLEIKEPMILNLQVKQDEHYVVVYKIEKNKMLIADPADKDIKWIEIEKIEKIFTGYFGFAKKVQTFKRKKNTIFCWATLLFEENKFILVFFFTSFFLNVIIIISNTFLKNFSKLANVDVQSAKIIFFATYASIFLVQIILSYYLERIIFVLKVRVSRKMNFMYFDKLLTIDAEKFETVSKDEWVQKISHLNNIAQTLTQLFLILPNQTLFFVISVILIGFISPNILLLLILEMILMFASSLFFNGILRGKFIEQSYDSLVFSTLFRELLEGNKEIKNKQIQDVFRQKLTSSFEKNIFHENRTNSIVNTSGAVMSLITKTIFILIFYLAQSLILKNQLTFNQLLFYVTISMYLSGFLDTLLKLIIQRENCLISLNETKIILQKVESENRILEINKITKIACSNLYKYRNDVLSLKNFNYVFENNTFLYGKSGIGKTTLLEILSGTIQEFEGNVTINDIKINSIDVKILRDRLIYLGQYDYLFNTSVWGNLQYFKNHINLAIFKDLGLADLLRSHNIDLTKEVYNNGSNLSKGQRQIINFIALFFTNKEVYLLDEPLSNVDRESANYLIKTFINYKTNCLIIMCDHNFEYNRFFDRKLELFNG